MKSLPILLCLCANVLFSQSQTTISGKLLGYDKKPMALSHVHLIKAPNPVPLAQVPAARDGSFEISTAETGLIVLVFTGVNHQVLDVPLLLENPTKIGLSVRLRTNAYSANFTDVKIMSDITNFVYEKAQSMELQNNGTFALELETKKPKFAYQLLGVEESGRSINGTQSESFEFDGGGDYRSIVTPKNGKVRIVFDPRKLVRSNAAAEVRFSDTTSTVVKVAMIQMEMLKRSAIWSEAIKQYVNSGHDWKTFTYDWSADQSSILSRLEKERDPLAHQALLLDYVDTKYRNAATAEPGVGMLVLREIPPNSKLWMLPTLALMKAAAGLAGNEAAYEQYLFRFLDENPDAMLKQTLLWNELLAAKTQQDEKRLKLFYDLAIQRFEGTPFGDEVKKRFSAVNIIAVGRPLPAFKVKVFDDTLKTYTNATFKGKVLLIDFWASWCQPCVNEMPNLHAVYEKFRSKNFEILSLSLDHQREDVTTFRKEKWKMPWLHSYVTDDVELAAAFEIVTIPRPILVDGSGKIVALEEELRGPNLEKTLMRFLK